LNDDEIRALWRATEAAEGPFGHLVRFLLLTATRRNEAARMTRGEVLPNDDWIIPAERMKAKQEHLVPLSPAAKAIIDGMPKLGSYLFTTGGRCPMRNFGKVKTGLDAAMLAEMRKTSRRRYFTAWSAPRGRRRRRRSGGDHGGPHGLPGRWRFGTSAASPT